MVAFIVLLGIIFGIGEVNDYSSNIGEVIIVVD